jgi:hypothetical protein
LVLVWWRVFSKSPPLKFEGAIKMEFATFGAI